MVCQALNSVTPLSKVVYKSPGNGPDPTFFQNEVATTLFPCHCSHTMYRPKDPELANLGHQAGEQKFGDPNEAHCRSVFQSISRSGQPFRNCYFNLQTKTWVVTLFLSGAQRRIGFFEDGYHASRFANMAIYHFWKYRKSGRACFDSDLIYGVDQAKADLDFYKNCSGLLCSIEGHLIATDVLRTGEASEEIQAQTNFRYDVRKHAQAWNVYCNAWRQLQKNFTGGPAGKIHSDTINESIDTHTKLVNGVHQLKPNE